MYTRTTPVSLILIGLMLGALVTWTPPVYAEGATSDEADMQAQNIQVFFDSVTEQTTVSWSNIDTNNGTLWGMLQNTYYLLYRHSGPLNASVIASEGLEPWANVSACTALNIAECTGTVHMGHQSTYPLPAGTNGTFYYAITTYYQPTNTTIANFIHGESNVTEGIEELTNMITAPFFVQADYDPDISATDISWINLNTIVPDSLPEVGPSAYTINVWRHTFQATRENWQMLNKDLVVTLPALSSTYRYNVPADTDESAFYSVTYYQNMYEDVRFLGTNTLTNPIHEDNIAPEAITNVQASFAPESLGGTGNTTISWDEIPNENGETYHIWRSALPINNTSLPEVEFIGEIGEGFGFYRHQIDRGNLGNAYYAVTASDSNGNHNNSVSSVACITNPVTENTFDPWVAEPTNVFAEFLGNSQTRITWTDQLGVEGETYHVWRASERLTHLSNLEVVAELVATVPDSVETVTVDIPDGLQRSSYYCVTSLARYSSSSEPYEDLRFNNNCYGSFEEDTQKPQLAFLQEATMTDQGGEKITLLRWLNDITESAETYQIWVHHGDPFNGNTSLSSGDIALDSGWQQILEPIDAPFNDVPDFTRTVSLETNLDQITYYAITTTDQWGNTNTQFSISSNARAVIEDTTPAILTIEIEENDGGIVDSLHAGQYRLYVYSNEPLSDYPIINLTTTDMVMDQLGTVVAGQAFTEQTSAVRATPLANVQNGFKYDFEVPTSTDTSQLRLILSATDSAMNVATIDLIGWDIDAQIPTIEVYAPTASSLYLYGESIHVYGAVSDDVGIESVQIRFQYYDSGLKRNTEWTNVTDLSIYEGDDGTFVFEWWEPASTFVDLGSNQRVFLRATDTANNIVEWETQFTVDHCIRIASDYSTVCDGQSSMQPLEPEEADEPGYFDGVYIMVYMLGAVNLILLIIVMLSLVLMSSDGKKKSEELEDEDEWMMEFMGGDSDVGSAEDVRADLASLSEDATERADAEDPFAASEGRDRKRRTKKKAEEVVEDDADDEDEDESDEFDDEDDWDDDEDDEPKKSVKRKAVKRKAVKRKKSD
ncbi:MAG: hypothetical protein VX320_06830 [Candidatus Thermoplasmatota archaeon]|nr:hypothetical protein [Candidatus Thermoplasmatota archaeon]